MVSNAFRIISVINIRFFRNFIFFKCNIDSLWYCSFIFSTNQSPSHLSLFHNIRRYFRSDKMISEIIRNFYCQIRLRLPILFYFKYPNALVTVTKHRNVPVKCQLIYQNSITKSGVHFECNVMWLPLYFPRHRPKMAETGSYTVDLHLFPWTIWCMFRTLVLCMWTSRLQHDVRPQHA